MLVIFRFRNNYAEWLQKKEEMEAVIVPMVQI